MRRVLYITAPIVFIIALIGWLAFLANRGHIDVLTPTGEVAAHQKSLLLFTLTLSGIVVVPVFTMLIYFAVKYRAGNNATYNPDWSENKVLESLWWGIPIVIIGILGTVTFQTSHSLDPRAKLAGANPTRVQVIALQWKWLFLYPDDKVATLNYMPLQINRPVTISLTADAPMSAFWIPALGSQTYAMNGMQSTLNVKGTELGQYTGYSTNINGKGYASMKFAAKVMDSNGYRAWLENAKTSPTVLTMHDYHELATAKSETDERTYRITDARLFDRISNMHSDHTVHEDAS